MTPLEPPRKRRSYQKHGLTALQTALRAVSDREGWLEGLGEVGHILKAWQADLVADLGGEEAVSAQERAVVELAVKTYLLLESVDRWLLEQPSLVNKSRRQVFPVVLQRQQLADALARYMIQLGLRRRAKPVPNLQDYLHERYGQTEGEEQGSSPPPQPSHRHTRNNDGGIEREGLKSPSVTDHHTLHGGDEKVPSPSSSASSAPQEGDP